MIIKRDSKYFKWTLVAISVIEILLFIFAFIVSSIEDFPTLKRTIDKKYFYSEQALIHFDSLSQESLSSSDPRVKYLLLLCMDNEGQGKINTIKNVNTSNHQTSTNSAIQNKFTLTDSDTGAELCQSDQIRKELDQQNDDWLFAGVTGFLIGLLLLIVDKFFIRENHFKFLKKDDLYIALHRYGYSGKRIKEGFLLSDLLKHLNSNGFKVDLKEIRIRNLIVRIYEVFDLAKQDQSIDKLDQDKLLWVLTTESYFRMLEHEEMHQARKASLLALIVAIAAILVSIIL